MLVRDLDARIINAATGELIANSSSNRPAATSHPAAARPSTKTTRTR